MSTLTVSNVSDGTTSVGTTYVTNGSAKAWVNFNGTGTIAARDSLNVSSLTDNGTGLYTINFANAFDNANYAPLMSGGDMASLGRDVGGSSNATRLTSSFDLRTLNGNQSVFTDCDTVYSAFFGDLT